MIKKNFIAIFSGAFILLSACNNAPDSDKAVATDAKEVTPTGGISLKVDTVTS